MSAWTPDYEIGVVLDEQGRQIAAVSPRNREKHLKLIAAAPELSARVAALEAERDEARLRQTKAWCAARVAVDSMDSKVRIYHEGWVRANAANAELRAALERIAWPGCARSDGHRKTCRDHYPSAPSNWCDRCFAASALAPPTSEEPRP